MSQNSTSMTTNSQNFDQINDNKFINNNNNSINDNKNGIEDTNNQIFNNDEDLNNERMQSKDQSMNGSIDCNERQSLPQKTDLREEQNSNPKPIHNKINAMRSDQKQKKDMYCWECHKSGINFSCKACPRSYHLRCSSKNRSKTEVFDEKNEILCAECKEIEAAEEETNPMGCMSWLKGNVNELSKLLEFTIITVKAADKNQTFSKPVCPKKYTDYNQHIVNPMDLSIIEKNITEKTYGSTKSFFADVKWIHHNCVVYNGTTTPAYINQSKNIIRVAKQECDEIEICPDCYHNYYRLEESDYFAATCRKPHAIVWAKLAGHPYWPAKVVKYDKNRRCIDVRFFGTHDKCWLRPESCYFMSKEYPTNKKPYKFDEQKFNEAIRDMNSHLDALEIKFPGHFKFREIKTVFNVDNLYLKENIKSYNGFALKKLTIKTPKCDIRSQMNCQMNFFSDGYEDLEIKEPENKKLRRSVSSNSSANSPNRQFSRNSHIRLTLSSSALSSSIDSCQETERSMIEEKIDSEVEHSVNYDFNSEPNSESINENDFDSDENFDRNNSTNNSNGNRENSDDLETNSSPNLKTFTVLGNSSLIVHINDTNKSTTNNDSNNDFTNGRIHNTCDIRQHSKDRNRWETELDKSKMKSLSLQIRKLKEEKDLLKSENEKLTQKNKEFEQKFNEMEKSIEEIKRKQWCNNCLKEAILPCCWNTCYCTVDCQYKHWNSGHRTKCTRKQRTVQQQTKV